MVLWFISFVVFWTLVCHTVVHSNADKSVEPDCKTLFTTGYGYRQFFHMSTSAHTGLADGERLMMQFMVKARSDAHILLSPSPSPEEADPVYEIVLGAGKNSFSDIRRKRLTGTKTTDLTKDVLSGNELKGFWVKIKSDGFITVGKAGEDLPFMKWQDPEPLTIEYFSFCTWSGVAGKWLYDCHDNKSSTGTNTAESGSVPVQSTMTETERLRQALLTNYDIYTIPITNFSQSLPIYLQMQVNHISLNDKTSLMSVDCTFLLEWSDDKMVWNPSDFGNLSFLNLIHHEIWQPALFHLNGDKMGAIVGDGTVASGLRVTADGRVSWRPHNILQTRCLLNLNLWPWDRQTCQMQLGFWSQPEQLALTVFENGTKLDLQNERENFRTSEWDLLQVSADSLVLKSLLPDLQSDNDYTNQRNNLALNFSFVVQRVNVGVYYVLVIPLIVLVVMSLTCFWMDPLGPEKLAINCLLVVLLCGFLLNLISILPAQSNHIPFLVKVYSCVLLIITCASVFTAVITNFMVQPHNHLPPRLICALLTSQLISLIFFLPKPKPKATKYGQLSGSEGDRCPEPDCFSLVANRLVLEGENGSLCCAADVDCVWSSLSLLCDRVAFLVVVIIYTAIFIY